MIKSQSVPTKTNILHLPRMAEGYGTFGHTGEENVAGSGPNMSTVMVSTEDSTVVVNDDSQTLDKICQTLSEVSFTHLHQ
jgi:hypothetical protein